MSPRGGGGTPSLPPYLPPSLPPSIMIYMKLASINFSSTPETLCNIRHDATQRGRKPREEEEVGYSRNFPRERERRGRGGLQQKFSERERDRQREREREEESSQRQRERDEIERKEKNEFPTSSRRRWRRFCLKWDFVFSPPLESPSQSSPETQNSLSRWETPIPLSKRRIFIRLSPPNLLEGFVYPAVFVTFINNIRRET